MTAARSSNAYPTRHLRGFFRRLCLLFLPRMFTRCSAESFRLHVRAGFAEAMTAEDMLADGTIVFGIQLQNENAE